MTYEEYVVRGYRGEDYAHLSQWQRWRELRQWQRDRWCPLLPEIVLDLNFQYCRTWKFGFWSHQTGCTFGLGPVEIRWWME